ncbi:hypothetical protein [Corallococcus sp. EGB]|uniref:hypothetical protein n=1 Tax=Corallococcus sp. EGB TaxID=1521117 RepID=UPI001CC09C40|nr:hypothetical protein [Corallococcus sp. EGB]
MSSRKRDASAKDETEWKHFEMFRQKLADFPMGQVQKVPPPAADFRVDTPQGALGIELARIIDGPLREQEVLREMAVEAGRLEYMRRGRPNVEVHFLWLNSPNKGAECRPLGLRFANLVEAHIPPDTGNVESIELTWLELRSADLSRLVHSIRIIRFPNVPLMWASSEGGWFDARADVVNGVVAQKTLKLPEYRRSCPQVWLLLVADGEGISGFVDHEDVAALEVESSFDRVYFLDFWSAHLHQLRASRPADK